MKTCVICKSEFDPEISPSTTAEEAGLHMARDVYNDAGEVCLSCLSSRGELTMMYCRELD
ncbi:MAG: hypothetical protein C0621_09230 [Desulfuromonas sp.]|nr:MAG: hypothetical protein C0621_09230 [Desulfuromonas sp.]